MLFLGLTLCQDLLQELHGLFVPQRGYFNSVKLDRHAVIAPVLLEYLRNNRHDNRGQGNKDLDKIAAVQGID